MPIFGVGANELAVTGSAAEGSIVAGVADGATVATAVPLPPMVTAISDSGSGAASTARHSYGRLAIVIRSRALGASGFLLGRQGSSVNHQASDSSQPSLLGVASCRLQPVEPGWQPMRI